MSFQVGDTIKFKKRHQGFVIGSAFITNEMMYHVDFNHFGLYKYSSLRRGGVVLIEKINEKLQPEYYIKHYAGIYWC